ncbi:MAG: two-component sensor histidine kinase, partial [Bradyrhizobium sp.]
MKLFSFLNLRGIRGQIAALVIVSIAALHLIITAVFLLHRSGAPDTSFDNGPAQIVAAAQLLGAAPASERPRLLGDLARAFPQLGIESLAPGSVPTAGESQTPSLPGHHGHLGAGYRMFALAAPLP